MLGSDQAESVIETFGAWTWTSKRRAVGNIFSNLCLTIDLILQLLVFGSSEILDRVASLSRLRVLDLDHEFTSSLHHSDYGEHCCSNGAGNTTVNPQACPLQFRSIVLQDGTTTGALNTCQVSNSPEGG